MEVKELGISQGIFLHNKRKQYKRSDDNSNKKKRDRKNYWKGKEEVISSIKIVAYKFHQLLQRQKYRPFGCLFP